MAKAPKMVIVALVLSLLALPAFGVRQQGLEGISFLSQPLNGLDHHPAGLIEVEAGTGGKETQKEDQCAKQLFSLEKTFAKTCERHETEANKWQCPTMARNTIKGKKVYEWQDHLASKVLDAGKTPVFWAGFWPGGKKGIDTRQAVADFISSVNGFQLANTGWGQAAEASDVHNLKDCAWEQKKNFWIAASKNMAESMSRARVRRIIIALHKNWGGNYSFYNSILFQAELRSMGLEIGNASASPNPWNPQFVLHSIPINGSEQSSGCALASKVKWRLEKYAKRRVTVFCKTCKTLEDCGSPNDLQKFDETAKCRTGYCKDEKGREGMKGFAIYKNKDKYRGAFKDGLQHGKGTYTWANGDKYEGEFKNGFEDGKGTFTWADGDKYEGEWKDGLRHGRGTLTLANNVKYEGVWEKGRKSGRGTLKVDAMKDLAEVKDVKGRRHGKGGNSRH